MSDTHEFQDVNKKYTLVVKNEFLTTCPTPETLDHHTLNAEHQMFKYLHNPNGPAIVRHDNGRMGFWLEGRLQGECLNDGTFTGYDEDKVIPVDQIKDGKGHLAGEGQEDPNTLNAAKEIFYRSKFSDKVNTWIKTD